MLLRRFTALDFSHRKPTDADITAVRTVSADPTASPIMTTEGWLSTDRLANDGLVIPAQAWDLSEFLQHPSLRFMHQTPIGYWFDLQMRENGLYGSNSILDTTAGRDTAILVRGGSCRAYSVSWDPLTFEYVRDGDHYRAIYCKAIEGSIVDAPCDVDADILAVRSFLESNLRRTINFDFGASAQRSRSTMTPEEIARLQKAEADAKSAQERAAAAEVKVADVQKEKDKLSREIAQFQDAIASGKRTQEEQAGIIQKATAEIATVKADMDRKITELQNKRTVTRESAVLSDMTVEEILGMTEGDMNQFLTSSEREQVQIFHRLNDNACLVGAIMAPGRPDQMAAQRAAVIKETRTFKRASKFLRAMDTVNATEGLEWIPAPFSATFIREFRLPLVLANLFPSLRFASKTLTVPTEGAAVVATYVPETQTVVSAFVSTEQTPVTGQLVLTPKKYKGRTQVSREVTEDSIIAILPYVSNSVQYSIGWAWEYALLTGQATGTHFDTNITASTDARKSVNGLRYFADSIRSTDGVDGSSFNVGVIQNCRAKMGKYGINPIDLALICSIKGYLTRLLNKTEMEEVYTVDKYGANAVVVTGELAKVLGIPIVVSPAYPDNLAATGRYDGAVTSQTSMLLANRNMFLQGIRRDIEVFTEQDIQNDVYQIVAYARWDVQPVVTPTTGTAVTVNSIFNVNTVS